MSELTSVGIDVGTTSTQLVVSSLTVENRASSFAVPQMEITRREILYKSPVYFTPLTDEAHVDGDGIRGIVEQEYRQAGICREQVDTGAIIITGETSRKENARRVLEALSDFAGEFVVATAGPDLESVLAAKGAGAVDYSAKTGKTVLHMDIGGGTSNLALIRRGELVATGCLNVGGRLVRLDDLGKIAWISPALNGVTSLRVGETPKKETLETLAEDLTRALEMAAGLREPEPLLDKLRTREAKKALRVTEPVVLSFSGGVADCIHGSFSDLAFGDLGPILGRHIRKSRLCQGEYRLGTETIRATVIGAGSHTTQLSGSTVFCSNVRFPLKNIPVAAGENLDGAIQAFEEQEEPGVMALAGIPSPSYRQVAELADALAARIHGPVRICLEADMAKALGQALAARLPRQTEILCLDRVKLSSGSYLDIGAPVGGAFPVVVKTLAFESAGAI